MTIDENCNVIAREIAGTVATNGVIDTAVIYAVWSAR
jgi:hypothetical protein